MFTKKINKIAVFLFIMMVGLSCIIGLYIHSATNTDPTEENQNPNQEPIKQIDVDEQKKGIPVTVEEKEATSENEVDKSIQTDSKNKLDPKIYNVDVIENYNKDHFDVSQFDSLESLIYDLIEQYGINLDNISIAYYNFSNDQHVYVNEHNYIVAASTAKVPIVMAYLDLVDNGQYSLDTALEYVDYYYVEGAGNISNSSAQASYLLRDLMHEAIVYSDNTAWYTLVFNYPNNFSGIASYILEKTQFYNIPEYFYMDNYGSAYLYEQLLISVATDPRYAYLVELMKMTEPSQLFTSYINTAVLANKYGRVDEQINDIGIYYEDDQPQYALVAFTDNVGYADNFLEDLSLYVNMWYRYNNITNP